MSQALRKLTGNVSRSNTLVIFINQLRMKIGVMFGSPETTTGGNALKFYASVRLDIRRIGQLKDGEKIIGGRTRVKVVKNKMAAPFREAEFDVGYGTGISRLGEVIDLGVEAGIVEKSGSWLSYKDGRLGQGRDTAIRFLAEHPEVEAELSKQILAKHGLGKPTAAPAPAPAKPEAPAAPTKPQPAKAEKPATRAAA